MLNRLSPMIVLPAVLIAGVAGYVAADRPHGAATPAATASIAAARSGQLPPNHPAVAGMSPHPHAGGNNLPTNNEPPSLTWTSPASWQPRANPSAVRIATFKVGDGSEASIARAGGSIDQNVQRWASQFEGSPTPDRSEKDVHGLHVTTVRIAGTFLGAGMNPGAPPEKHDGWAMLVAVVESTGSPYFFKLIGPADQVDGARAAFDGLLDSVSPIAAPAASATAPAPTP